MRRTAGTPPGLQAPVVVRRERVGMGRGKHGDGSDGGADPRRAARGGRSAGLPTIQDAQGERRATMPGARPDQVLEVTLLMRKPSGCAVITSSW